MRRLLRRREREGLTYAELAELTGEQVHTLSWWAWRLRQESQSADDRAQQAFVEVEPADEPQVRGTGVEILLSSGQRLAVQPGFDEETLRRVVAALERPC